MATTDEQILKLRVGSSFDASELAYFGLFANNPEKLDSARYGYVSGAFYIEPFSNGKSERIVLTAASQAEFLRLIAVYEKYAQDARSLDVKQLRGLGIALPLKRHERNGFTVSCVSKSGQEYFGEVACVRGTKMLLYDLDMGYDAQLSGSDIRLIDIETLTEMNIYRRNVAKISGLIAGATIALAASGAGYSPFSFSSYEANVGANIIAFTGVGFLIGLLVDDVVSFRTHYDFAKPGSIEKALKVASKHVMFPKQLPPELARMFSPTQ